MSYEILKGSTDQTRYVMLVDATAGTPEINYTITDLDLQYTRNRVAPAAKADATALAATDSAHADNKAIQVDATSSPGLYRVDWPDAAFATGVDKVILVVSGTGLHPAVEEIQLVNFNPEDGVRLGLTALPNAAADAAGGLPISDAGALDLDAQVVTKINSILEDTGTTLQAEVDGIQAAVDTIDNFLDTEIAAILADTNELQVDWVNGGRLDLLIDAIKAKTDSLTFTVAGLTDANVLRIAGNAAAATNLSGSAQVIYIGSVTGAASTTTLVDSALTQADNDHWNGRIVIFLTGSLKYQATDITDFAAATDTLTFTALTNAPSGGDTYVVL